MYSLLFFDKMVSLKQSDESRTHADELQVHLSLTINVFLCDEVNLHDDVSDVQSVILLHW